MRKFGLTMKRLLEKPVEVWLLVKYLHSEDTKMPKLRTRYQVCKIFNVTIQKNELPLNTGKKKIRIQGELKYFENPANTR